MDLDSKNEFDADATMETNQYKLRSSLKKTKSRNPLGSLDITEVNADITLAPPPRRVSFAASNYVKPFLDDPEKNTIWDNTYEEEVNHTDSTKSENTNHTNLSELKSHQFQLQNTECIANIYCDESMIDMEVSCFDQTIVNEAVKDVSCDLDIMPCIATNIDVKNTTDFSKETSFNMELTCHWKNDIQSRFELQKEVALNKNYSQRHSLHEEEDMSMTCCFGNTQNQESKLLPTDDAEKSESENIFSVHQNDSDMEFTNVFPNKILQTGNTCVGMTAISANINKENILPSDPSGYFQNAKNENIFLLNQSAMEFTCTFSNKIFENVNQFKEKESSSSETTTVSENVKIKENLLPGDRSGCFPTVAQKEKACLPDQSEMEFTCTFANKILETVNQLGGTENNFVPMTAVSVNVENKENLSPGDSAGCFPIVGFKNEKIFVPDQSEMEFTCTFPNQILETINKSKGTKSSFIPMTAVSKDVDNKENILPSGRAGCLPMDYDKSEKVVLPDESGMEFTCTFPNKTLETLNQSKKNESDSLANPATNECIQNKENRLPDNAGCFSTDCKKKENDFLPDRSEMKFTYIFPKKILEPANQPNKHESDSLAKPVVSEIVQNKEKLVPYDLSGCSKSKTQCTSRFNTERLCETRTYNDTNASDNFKMIHSILKKDQNLMQHDTLRSNDTCTTSNKNNLLNSPPNTTTTTLGMGPNITSPTEPTRANMYKNLRSKQNKLISTAPKANTEMIKPAKVREFGNIPIIVDVTDLSIDKNINDHGNAVSDTGRRHYNLKENTYTVCVVETEKKFVQLKQDPFVGREVNNDLVSQNDLISFDEIGEKIIRKSVCADSICKQIVNPASIPLDQNIAPVISKMQNLANLKRGIKFISNVELDSPEKPATNKQKSNIEMYLSKNHNKKQKNANTFSVPSVASNEYRDFTENNKADQVCITKNQIKKTPPNESENQINTIARENADACIAEECIMLENIEESILINSITIPDEEELKHLTLNLSQNKTDHDVSLNKVDRNDGVKEQDVQVDEKMPATKVIYSEPMKVKPFHDEFPSMQTSGMNPFNFSSIAEDTQMLIQATFSKPSFIKTEQFEDDKIHSGFIPEPNLSECNEKSELNRSDTVALQSETLKAESIFQNIKKKLDRCKLEPINYEEIVDSIKANRDISDRMEKLLSNYQFPEICTFNLQEKTRKMSLPHVSFNGNSSDSLLEILEFGEDNNKSMLLEPNSSLHEKIVNVCTRSKKLLNIQYFEESSYIFTAMYKCVMIYVDVHPEDGRVTDIKTASSLGDSRDIVYHFLVKNILDKLKQSTLISYLGPHYDVLSLLDHICLMVDEVMDFHHEFLSLQKMYPTLRINSDYSISLEILHNCPPIWWIITLDMTSVNKINPEVLQLESKWGNINEEHIKQILINIDEGVESLRSFTSNVFKYFERTQLRFKVQQAQ